MVSKLVANFLLQVFLIKIVKTTPKIVIVIYLSNKYKYKYISTSFKILLLEINNNKR